MRNDGPSHEDDAGYVGEDAALASAGEPQSLDDQGARAAERPPTPEELDAREERIGARKPMGPGLDTVPETVPEELPDDDEDDKPKSRRRKKEK